MREHIATHPGHATDDAVSAASSPHMVGHYAGLHGEDRPYTSTVLRTHAARPPVPDDAGDEDIYPTRSPSSVRRYQTDQQPTRTQIRVTQHPVPPRRSALAAPPQHTQDQPRLQRAQPASTPRRFHRLFFVGLVLIVIVAGWLALLWATAWWQVQQDDWHYGRPRTMQIDAVVGHHDSAAHPSHYVALNLHGHTEVIEQQGGDPARTKVYTGPILTPTHALDPVTIRFADVNGDGKPAMILTVDNLQVAFLNDADGFRLARQDEHVNL